MITLPEIAWEIVAALGSLTAAIVATLVFWEARAIRQTEWLLRQNQAWNDLGRSIAELHEGSRIAELLMGNAIQPPLSAKESFLLMSYFNVVSSEYNAYRAGAIRRRYVIHSFSVTNLVIDSNKEWIFGFLISNGYDPDFVRALAIVLTIGDDIHKRDINLRRELRASSRIGTFCGGKYRAWLRRELNDRQIEELCGLKAT